jgi:pyruvate kinase
VAAIRGATRRPRGSVHVRRLLRRLVRLRQSLVRAEQLVPLASFGASHASARNLVHYLALRRYDLRKVQEELAQLGLSSLGRSEGHVLDNLDQVIDRLRSQEGMGPAHPSSHAPIGPADAHRRLEHNATRLFGPAPPGRTTRIMVTAPTEAAWDPRLLRELLDCGMDCLRINCARDTPEDRRRMVELLRREARRRGRRCRIEMDLGGPRLRTGQIEPGPSILKVRPERDEAGRVIRPGRVRFVEERAAGGLGTLPEIVVPRTWLERRRLGERVRFRDARASRRSVQLVERTEGSWVGTLARTAYLTNGLPLTVRAPGRRPDRCVAGGIEPRPGRIRLSHGSELYLSRSNRAARDRPKNLPRGGPTPSLGVTIPSVLASVRVGERVWFDSGRIGGVARSVDRSGVLVRINSAPPGGAWLRGDQGINLPDTDLRLPSLTPEDLAELPVIVRQVDLVGYSFVQSAADVTRLRAELRRLGRPRMGVVLKIETRRAFERLPEILLAALQEGPSAVMLARGDLAVEVGFERLSEVQEELLWLCEAAHMPAIWATQVLEGLAKGGIPSRAEVTDAAMGERAECVMLNKGPYLIPAVRALDSIVRRMQAHQEKKSARLRHLAVAERFLRSRRTLATVN